MIYRRNIHTFRDVTGSPSDWSPDDVEICQTNYPHPSIASGMHTNGPAMIWIRHDGGEWQRTGEIRMHKVRAMVKKQSKESRQ